MSVTLTIGEESDADRGEDYDISELYLIIPAGKTEAAIILTGINDRSDEDDEAIFLYISDVAGGLAGSPSQITATITDDDELPSVSLDLIETMFHEDGGEATVKVMLTHISDDDVSVSLNVEGTATRDTDYNASALTLTIPGGETEAVITLTGLDDDEAEGDETIILSIGNVEGGVAGSPSQADTAIRDDETATLIASHRAEPEIYKPGGELEITTRIEYQRELTSMRFEAALPDGWSYLSHEGVFPEDVVPEGNTVAFIWSDQLPESPIEMTYLVSIPDDAAGPRVISAEVTYRIMGESSDETVLPDPLTIHPENTSPEIIIESCHQRRDGSGRILVEFVGRDAEGDTVSWFEPETYCLFASGPDYDYGAGGPLEFDPDDPEHTAAKDAQERMPFSPEWTSYKAVVDASSWPSGDYKIQLEVEDEEGNHVNGHSPEEFRMDNTPPEIKAVEPADRETAAPADTVITAEFSEDMDASGIDKDTFFVTYESGEKVAGDVTYSDRYAEFRPDGHLDYGAGYSATITAGVRDSFGNTMESDYVWSFDIPENNLPSGPFGESPGDEERFGEGPVTLKSSQFEDTDRDTHKQTDWQIKRADGKISAYSVTRDDTDLTEHTVSSEIDPELKYVWRVKYKDSKGGFSPWSDKRCFKVGPSEKDTVRIDPGNTADDFRMVSFVLWPNDPAAESVIGDDMGEYDTNTYRIGAFNPVSGSYAEYGSDLRIEPGRACWVFARNGLDITVEGVRVSETHEIEVELLYNESVDEKYNGWNMIASPNDVDYDWDKVLVLQYDDDGTEIIREPVEISSSENDLVQKKLWEWKDGTYNYDYEITVMKSKAGYWVKALKENVFSEISCQSPGKIRRPIFKICQNICHRFL